MSQRYGVQLYGGDGEMANGQWKTYLSDEESVVAVPGAIGVFRPQWAVPGMGPFFLVGVRHWLAVTVSWLAWLLWNRKSIRQTLGAQGWRAFDDE